MKKPGTYPSTARGELEELVVAANQKHATRAVAAAHQLSTLCLTLLTWETTILVRRAHSTLTRRINSGMFVGCALTRTRPPFLQLTEWIFYQANAAMCRPARASAGAIACE